MKKIIVILAFVAFIAGMLVSCSQNICPAYSSNDDTEQVENNG